MFGRATITLGIGPHSSFLCFLGDVLLNFHCLYCHTLLLQIAIMHVDTVFMLCT